MVNGVKEGSFWKSLLRSKLETHQQTNLGARYCPGLWFSFSSRRTLTYWHRVRLREIIPYLAGMPVTQNKSDKDWVPDQPFLSPLLKGLKLCVFRHFRGRFGVWSSCNYSGIPLSERPNAEPGLLGDVLPICPFFRVQSIEFRSVLRSVIIKRFSIFFRFSKSYKRPVYPQLLKFEHCSLKTARPKTKYISVRSAKLCALPLCCADSFYSGLFLTCKSFPLFYRAMTCLKQKCCMAARKAVVRYQIVENLLSRPRRLF